MTISNTISFDERLPVETVTACLTEIGILLGAAIYTNNRGDRVIATDSGTFTLVESISDYAKQWFLNDYGIRVGQRIVAVAFKSAIENYERTCLRIVSAAVRLAPDLDLMIRGDEDLPRLIKHGSVISIRGFHPGPRFEFAASIPSTIEITAIVRQGVLPALSASSGIDD
ncbi:hypothetical protein ACNOYE_14265 [Nannocystaceae bacterium ST9]